MLGHLQPESAGTSALPDSRTNASLPWWVFAIVILGSLLMATGGFIALIHPAMLVSPDTEINQAAHVFAGYLVSRNLALAVMLLVMLGIRARGALRSLMVLTASIQLLDAGMDLMERRWTLVPGILLFALVFFLGAARLSEGPLWKLAAWRKGQQGNAAI